MIKKNFFKKIIIDCNSFIFQALRKLNKNDIKILFVKEKKKIVGTLTDGDIRRILLKENHTRISINNKYNKKFLFFFETKFNSEKANKIMRRKQIFAAPILNYKRELKDLYFLNQSTQKKINADVFILAGGLGKRMGPLTTYNPKPMLLLGGKPILESIIYSFKEFGMSNFFISINYLGKKIENYFRDGKQLNVNIKYIKEKAPLGTAGSLSLLKNKLQNKNLIIINGDIFTKLNYYNLLKFHEDNHNYVTICSRHFTNTIPYGIINSNYKSSINKQIINEKPTYKFQISAGIYVFNREVLKNINKNKYLDMNILLNLLSKNKKIGIFPVHEDLIDVGDYKSYENAKVNFFR
jgi:dTDP-glucose pyrophosphorylase